MPKISQKALDNKREDLYSEMIKLSRSKNRSSRGMKVEDRLIKEGEKYKENNKKRTNTKHQRKPVRFMSEHSKRILHKKNDEDNDLNMRVPMTNEGTGKLASIINSMNHARTPSLSNKKVVSDFLNVPSTAPTKFTPSDFGNGDELLNSYREEIEQMVSGNSKEIKNGYNAKRRESKSRNNERMEQLILKNGKIDFTASGSKYQQTMGSSMSNIGKWEKHGRDQYSDELIEEPEYSDTNNINETNKFNETNTIEKVINGDYEDDENVNYYSIGSKSFGGQDSYPKEGFTTPEVSDPLIDPFNNKTEDEILAHEEFETAQLNVENGKEKEIINIQDYAEIYDNSDEINESKDIEDGSFDNSDQMNAFLKFIRKGKSNKETQEDEEFFKEKEKDVSSLIEEGMSMSENLLKESLDQSKSLTNNYQDQNSRPEIKEDDQQYSRPSFTNNTPDYSNPDISGE